MDCDDGDMTLFAGLLCASGDRLGCETVRQAQDGNGRWWRSPNRKGNALNHSISFSRDMSMGVLLYLVETRDTEAANKWLRWIYKKRPCLLENPLNGKCITYGAARFCTDEENQTCTLTSGNWALLGHVWDALGLEKTEEMKMLGQVDPKLQESIVAATPVGYQLHLHAVEVLLKAKLNVQRSQREAIADLIYSRQPENPFFGWLAGASTDELKNRLLTLCPSQNSSSLGSRRQWAWERDTSSAAWQDSMGWDCIFLDNLLKGNAEIPKVPYAHFYRVDGRNTVHFQFLNDHYCNVQNEDQMTVFGGFKQVKVVPHQHNMGKLTGNCGWPVGFYRRSHEAAVYRVSGIAGIFGLGSTICNVTDEAQLDRLGGAAQVRVVPLTSQLHIGLSNSGACSG
jgi:hypothetical protein